MTDLDDDQEDKRDAEDRLTDWRIEPKLEMLKEDVEAAKPLQAEHTQRIDVWLDNLHGRGKAAAPKVKGRSQVQPKLIRKQAEWRYSSLTEPFLTTQKMFTIKPVTWEDKEPARQNELLLNWQFNTKLNPVNFIDQYVRTCVDEGSVVVRVGWDRETRMEKVMAPVYEYYPIQDEQQLEALQQASQLMEENPKGFSDLPENIQESVRYSMETQQPMLAQQVGEQEVEEEKVLRNEPTIEIVNIYNLVVDATCGADPNKALFMAYSYEITRSKLETDGRYKNLDKINWGGSSILSEPDHVNTGPDTVNFKDKARQKSVITEYWGLFDIEGKGHLTPIMVAWINNVVVRCELNPFPDGKPPFVLVPYLPLRKTVYGEPDGELLADNQAILGAVTRGVIDLMARSANSQRGMAKNMLDPPNRRRFENGDDYEYNPGINPQNGLIEHKFPEIPQSAMGMMHMVNMDSESLTGVKMFGQEGISGASLGNTAAAATGVLNAAGKRETGILRRLAKGISIIGAKIVAMNQEFLSDEEVIRVSNEVFARIKREDLHGQFDYSVEIATEEEDQSKSKELAFMLQTIGPKGDWGMTQMILSEIADLRRMPDLAHKIRKYAPEPDPAQEEIKQLTIEKLKAEIALVNAQAMSNESKAGLDQARARTEGSTADIKDLDFVEQESGTKHAREMDKTAAQAEANQDLRITETILNRGKGGPKEGNPLATAQMDNRNIIDAFQFSEATKVRS
ncbi:MAG: portal protein [Pseudomonas sp.]